MKKVIVFLILVVFPVLVSAETSVTPTLNLGTSFYGGFGYQQPGLDVGGGLELSNRAVWISAGAGFSPTDKAPKYGNTYSYGGGITALGRLPGGVLAGAGVSYTKLVFTVLQTDKYAVRPRVFLGWENRKIRIIGDILVGGKDDSNHSKSAGASFEYYIHPKLRIESNVFVSTYDTVSWHPEGGRTTAVGSSLNFAYLPFRR